MNTVEKINVILKEANISKVNLAKYLGVSRQMVYNYLDGEDLSKLSNDKSQALFALLNVKNEDELKNIELTKEYIQEVGNKLFNSKRTTVKKNEIIELTGLRPEEQNIINDRIHNQVNINTLVHQGNENQIFIFCQQFIKFCQYFIRHISGGITGLLLHG